MEWYIGDIPGGTIPFPAALDRAHEKHKAVFFNMASPCSESQTKMYRLTVKQNADAARQWKPVQWFYLFDTIEDWRKAAKTECANAAACAPDADDTGALADDT